jgi:hypothetical protein
MRRVNGPNKPAFITSKHPNYLSGVGGEVVKKKEYDLHTSSLFSNEASSPKYAKFVCSHTIGNIDNLLK